MKAGFIGLGLIGGSIARAIRAKMPDSHITAFDLSSASLQAAVRDGVIDTAAEGVDRSFSGCDVIFLCTPVMSAPAYLEMIRPHLTPETVITDVGSTKRQIHEAVRACGLGAHFIGGHPMTGSEKNGYENSDALFLENAYYPVTPETDVPAGHVRRFRQLISDIGAIPIELDYELHDYVVGAISHLPHLVSASLVNLVRTEDGPDQLMQMLAAGGFKDITRISSSSPEMWRDISLANRENLLLLIERFRMQLDRFANSVRAADAEQIEALFSESKDYRDRISDERSGPIRREFRLYCDIVDERGSLARIAGLLADHGVSIRNIGIAHNREFEEGVLQILFYDQVSRENASVVLKRGGYHVYEY